MACPHRIVTAAVRLCGRVKFLSWDEAACLVLSWTFVSERSAGKLPYRCVVQDEQGGLAGGTAPGVAGCEIKQG